jgi:hypothetical protein
MLRRLEVCFVYLQHKANTAMPGCIIASPEALIQQTLAKRQKDIHSPRTVKMTIKALCFNNSNRILMEL